jgi:hypothetical protein
MKTQQSKEAGLPLKFFVTIPKGYLYACAKTDTIVGHVVSESDCHGNHIAYKPSGIKSRLPGRLTIDDGLTKSRIQHGSK